MRWEVLIGLVLVVSTAGSGAAGYVARDDSEIPSVDLDADANRPGHVYHTWETLTVELQELVNQHSDIARLHPGGQSVLGFEMWVVEIADVEANDSKPLDQREVVWLDGGTHANEQLGTELAFDWIEFLLTGYGENETATWIVENRHTFIMPMVNPDGNHKDSRANARQVDLNRNFPVGWGALDEGRPPVGPGSYPLSEPETRTIVDWWEKTQPDYINSFHSGIDLMLYPPGYKEAKPADHEVYRRICEEIGEGDPEFCGPIYSTIYPAAGGSIDTSYEQTGAISFAYELTTEQNMYASVEDPRKRLQRYWDGVEHAFLNVERYGAHPVIEGLQVGEDELELTIRNDGYGNLTQGHVTVDVPGAQDTTRELGPIPHGEATTLTLPIETSAADDGPLEASLTYQERAVSQLTETRTHALPVGVDGDALALRPLATNATGDVLEAQTLGESDTVPGPGPVLALALVALLALRRPRSRRR